jgi:transketolase
MAYEKILENFCRKYPDTIILTAENRALIRNLPSILGPRFVDTGITEQTMIGMAAGLALQGRKVICHALATFLTMRAFEFIRTDIGIPGLPVKLTGYIPGILSDANGPTHQALEDVALMLGIPKMEVYCPADAEDMDCMLEALWESPRPAYLRAVHLSSGLSHAPYEPGKAEWYRTPDNAKIVFLVSGFLFTETVKAADILQAQGVSVAIVNIRSLRPLDEESLLRVFGNYPRVICVEDHFRQGGLYSVVAEWLLQHPELYHTWLQKGGMLDSFSFQDSWFRPALLRDVLEYHGLSAHKMAEKVLTQVAQTA